MQDNESYDSLVQIAGEKSRKTMISAHIAEQSFSMVCSATSTGVLRRPAFVSSAACRVAMNAGLLCLTDSQETTCSYAITMAVTRYSMECLNPNII